MPAPCCLVTLFKAPLVTWADLVTLLVTIIHLLEYVKKRKRLVTVALQAFSMVRVAI